MLGCNPTTPGVGVGNNWAREALGRLGENMVFAMLQVAQPTRDVCWANAGGEAGVPFDLLQCW